MKKMSVSGAGHYSTKRKVADIWRAQGLKSGKLRAIGSSAASESEILRDAKRFQIFRIAARNRCRKAE